MTLTLHPSPPHPHEAVRDALADLLIRIDPASAGQAAIACIRLAAALVALGHAHDDGGTRSTATELLLLLVNGAPQLAEASAVAA